LLILLQTSLIWQIKIYSSIVSAQVLKESGRLIQNIVDKSGALKVNIEGDEGKGKELELAHSKFQRNMRVLDPHKFHLKTPL